jgi:hypothetical protein
MIPETMSEVPRLFLFSFAPLYAVYAGSWTSNGTICLTYSCLALATLFPVQLAANVVASSRRDASIRAQLRMRDALPSP